MADATSDPHVPRRGDLALPALPARPLRRAARPGPRGARPPGGGQERPGRARLPLLRVRAAPARPRRRASSPRRSTASTRSTVTRATCARAASRSRAGSSLDVTELDAASNNGVDDIREITAGAWHGTPGRWKVYIFDEVHQLSKAASAALLKTLEEPPPHVVFVLATTDPHKVLPTIRSRTQHLEFRLIGGDTLSSLLHDVQGAAGLRRRRGDHRGRGSPGPRIGARRAERPGPTGRDRARSREAQPEFDGLFAALADADAVGGARVACPAAPGGLGPRAARRELRRPRCARSSCCRSRPRSPTPSTGPRAAQRVGRELGLARTVRILETFGRAMREMKSAPEKIVILEVALVRLVKPELDASLDALDERLTKLERSARSRSAPPAAALAPVLRPIGSTAPDAPPVAPSTPAAAAPSSRRRRAVRRPSPAEVADDARGRGACGARRGARALHPARRPAHVARRAAAAASPREVARLRWASASPSRCPARRCARTPTDTPRACSGAIDHEFKVTPAWSSGSSTRRC